MHTVHMQLMAELLWTAEQRGSGIAALTFGVFAALRRARLPQRAHLAAARRRRRRQTRQRAALLRAAAGGAARVHVLRRVPGGGQAGEKCQRVAAGLAAAAQRAAPAHLPAGEGALCLC